MKNCGLDKRRYPYRVSDGAYSRSSIYKRGEPLVSHCTSSGTAETSFLDPKIAPHALYKVPLRHLPAPLAPQFFGFFALFHLFLKIFSPRALAHVRRALNRLAAPSPSPKTPEFRGKTAHPYLVATPKSPAKHRPRALKNPPLTPLRIKKLSKVRSTLLTPLPGECILEYMRLKEPRRPPHTGRHAQCRPPPKFSNYPASH